MFSVDIFSLRGHSSLGAWKKGLFLSIFLEVAITIIDINFFVLYEYTHKLHKNFIFCFFYTLFLYRIVGKRDSSKSWYACAVDEIWRQTI